MREIKTGRVYRHFKGDFYLVEATAFDSETGEEVVVYRNSELVTVKTTLVEQDENY